MDTRGRSTAVRRELKRLLDAGVAGHVFPGAVASVAWWQDGTIQTSAAAGGLLGRGLPPAKVDTPYDLSALTRLFVSVAAMRLVEAQRLRLEATIEDVLGDLRGGVLKGVLIGELLAHRAGLADWGGFFLDVPHDLGSAAARRWLISEISRRPGDGEALGVDSDLGYIVVGEVLSRARGESLDRVIAHEVTEPLAIDEAVVYAGALSSGARARLARAAAATERCEWRGRVVRGEALDENAAILGGVAGHAGLFGTAEAVARFGASMLQAAGGDSSFLTRGSCDQLLGRGDGHPLGWKLKATPGPVAVSAGRRLSEQSFGEVGITGTSLWCDPERGLAVALLSNRVHPSRANEKITGFRPAFHDGVVAAWSRG